MGRGIILVRHAMPEVTPGLSSKLWPLGESAREDCVLLAHALPPDLAANVYSSDEKKASETAAIMALRRGLQVVHDAAFAEVDRLGTWDEDYRLAVAGYLTSGERPGWEPAQAVRARFGAGVARALDAEPAGDIVITDHGMALSLYLSSVATIDLVPFWRSLTFPDAWRLDLETRVLTRVFAGGLTAE